MITKRIVHATRRCRENGNVRDIRKGEARHRKHEYKGYQLCGGQMYEDSSDQAAVVT
jgi:hypothetical protein